MSRKWTRSRSISPYRGYSGASSPPLNHHSPCLACSSRFPRPVGARGAAGAAGGAGRDPTLFSPDRVIVQWAPGADHGDKAEARAESRRRPQERPGQPRLPAARSRSGQKSARRWPHCEADPAVVAVAERDGYSSLDSHSRRSAVRPALGSAATLGTGVDGFSGALAGADVSAPTRLGPHHRLALGSDRRHRLRLPLRPPGPRPGRLDQPRRDRGNGIDDDGNGFIDDMHGYDFVGSSADSPDDRQRPDRRQPISGGHGVHTAGTMGAAGNNAVGITGVAQHVRIMPLRVCANFAVSERQPLPLLVPIAAINYAGDNGRAGGEHVAGRHDLQATSSSTRSRQPGPSS